ncbi:MAG: hypothetical protein JXC85_04210 [Candidatus Aenigmarchaeota archaeon]|nr:hypothetical protein [Candidatus Aenigmarchaeota archaeon]
MVFKILKAGRRIRSLDSSLDSELDLKRFLAEREEMRKRHPLHEDMEILKKDVEWLRFSQESAQFIQSVGKADEAPEPEAADAGAETRGSLPVVEDVLMGDHGLAGESVIMEGDIEFYNRKKNGERWHIFSDRTGALTAVSRKELRTGPGTLFGVIRRTTAGKQTYLEIKNFHPKA